MDAELRAKWIEALRSGEYKQGEDVLRDSENRFCCLGVLYDISGREWTNNAGTWETDRGESCYLLAHSELIDKDFNSKLANLNDNGTPFAEIAGYIEANVPLTSPEEKSNG